jgi:hypothetical protein
VFWTGKPTKGVPEVADYAVEDRDREIENSKVCARTRDTRFIQVQVAKVANPTSCLGIKYGALRLVLCCSDARLGTDPPLYSPGGGFLVGYKAESASRPLSGFW